MSKPRTVISSIGSHGEKIVNELNKQGLLEVDFMTQSELLEDRSINIFILFIIYCPEDHCIKKLDEIAGIHAKRTIIEIIITDRIERQNPYYIINNLVIDVAVKEISTFIKAFTDLGNFPSQACIDMADIIDSLKNAGRLRMEEFTFRASKVYNTFSQLFIFLATTKKIKTIWLQIYLHTGDDFLDNVLEKLLDAINLNIGSEVDILWNVSYEEPLIKDKENRYVLLFC